MERGDRISSQPRRFYGFSGSERERSAPDYGRVAAALNDVDLAAELERGLGGEDYQAAVQAEADRRGLRDAV